MAMALLRNALNYLMQYLLFMVANMLSNVGYLLCCVGIAPATCWAVCVLSWAEGDVELLRAEAMVAGEVPGTAAPPPLP